MPRSTLDGAGWHAAKDLVVPEGIDLVFQPPYPPELQPSEQLWPLLHEPLANRNFVDLDELEDVLYEACCGLEDDPDTSGRRPCSTGGATPSGESDHLARLGMNDLLPKLASYPANRVLDLEPAAWRKRQLSELDG